MHLESVYCKHLHYLSNRHTLMKLGISGQFQACKEGKDDGGKREREAKEKENRSPKRKYDGQSEREREREREREAKNEA